MNNFDAVSIPVLISKDTVLNAFKLSLYFIDQAKKVKVSAKETKSIAYIIETNKSIGVKEKFEIMLNSGEKIDFTKVAEMLGVSRQTLYNWSKMHKV